MLFHCSFDYELHMHQSHEVAPHRVVALWLWQKTKKTGGFSKHSLCCAEYCSVVGIDFI